MAAIGTAAAFRRRAVASCNNAAAAACKNLDSNPAGHLGELDAVVEKSERLPSTFSSAMVVDAKPIGGGAVILILPSSLFPLFLFFLFPSSPSLFSSFFLSFSFQNYRKNADGGT